MSKDYLLLNNHDFKIIQNWFLDNNLSLNLNKTKYMIFHLMPIHVDFSFKIHLMDCVHLTGCNCMEIERVNSIKYLGVFFDSNLKFRTHIDMLKRKLNFMLNRFYYLKNVVDYHFLRSLYFSWVHSVISYGSIIWGFDYFSSLSPVINLQKKILKIVNSKKDSLNTYLTDPIMLRELIVIDSLVMLHKNKELCKIKSNINVRRQNELFYLPTCKKEIFKKHFFYFTPKFYNSLPVSLQSLNDYRKFKKEVTVFVRNFSSIENYF